MHAQSRPREPPDRLNLLPVAFKQVDQAPSSLHGALGRVAHAVGEEREPLLPISRLPHALQQVVVARAVLLEVQGQVQERLPQHPLGAQQQGDQEPSDAPVTVQKGMNRLELHVGERRLEQDRRRFRLVVQPAFERPHAFRDALRGRRDEHRVPRPGSPYPVLGAAEFAGLPVGPSTALEEHAVDLADQSVRQRKVVSQPAQPVFESGDVVRHLYHVVEGDARRFLQLEQQEIRERRLRPFNLRGKNCFLAHIGVEE